MSWFERLTGIQEESPGHVRAEMDVEGARLRSRRNGRSWQCGHLETPTLAELRERVRSLSHSRRANSVREIVADVQQLHADHSNAHALFQVASQFNLLEMVGPKVTPEQGIGIYESDHTQGPACAIAAGAGTIFRNYFAEVNGRIGQSADNQIDCLAGVGTLLGNSQQRLWRMVNGYALPSSTGLREIDQKLAALDEPGRDRLRAALQVGLQTDTQVTLHGASHVVTQAFCSALPVGYSTHQPAKWKRFASLILEAAYEATICAAICNAERTGNNRLFLTLLGGGAFGNQMDWIIESIRHALTRHRDGGLEVAIVSYGSSKPEVRPLVAEFAGS